MGTKIRMVKIFFKIQKLWQNRRRANGIRVEHFPRIQYVAAQWRSQTFTVEIRWDTRELHKAGLSSCRCSMIFPVDQKTTKKNAWQMPNSYLCAHGVLKRSGTVSVKTVHKEYGTILRKGCCWNLLIADAQLPRYEPIVQRSTQKQRTWKIVDTLCSRFGNGWDYFSHDCRCKPAQSLRCSRGDMWRVWIPSRENGETRCDGAIEFLTRAQCDQDRSSFGLCWPGQPRSSIAAIWRTNLKAVTTRQNEQILYGCMISECCWNWTILQDERHCRSLTISCSGLSWIHSSKRRRSITTKRMDPREHKDWARIRKCNQLLAR